VRNLVTKSPMAKRNKIPMHHFAEKLQSEYLRDVLAKVAGVLHARGFVFSTPDEFNDFFKNRVTKNIHETITTLMVDGVEICAYGPLITKAKGKEIDTSFKWVEL